MAVDVMWMMPVGLARRSGTASTILSEANLIAHAPPGAPCHKSFTGPLGTLNLYDKNECEFIYENFGVEQWQYVLCSVSGYLLLI